MDLENEKELGLLLNKNFDLIVAIDVLEHLVSKNTLLKKISELKNTRFILQCPNLYSNIIGTNYEFKLSYIINKIISSNQRLFEVWGKFFLFTFFNIKTNLKEITKIKQGLDWKSYDYDAVVLTSSFWFLLFFKQHGFTLKKFTTFSFPTKKNDLRSF